MLRRTIKRRFVTADHIFVNARHNQITIKSQSRHICATLRSDPGFVQWAIPPLFGDHAMTAIDLATKSNDELIAIIEAMSKASQSRLTLKVSEKGALSLYGMGQWPVTLYRSQWERLIDFVPEISAFIATHQAVLAVKPPK
jgi:hypothetical protein